MRQAAYPVRCILGRFEGRSVEILPWKRALPFLFSESDGVEEAEGGTYSKFALEKPPISASDMTLHESIDSGSWKVVSTYGAVGLRVASAFNAVEDHISFLKFERVPVNSC